MQVRNPIIPDNTRMQSFLIVFKFRNKRKKFKAGQDTENFQRTNVYHALSSVESFFRSRGGGSKIDLNGHISKNVSFIHILKYHFFETRNGRKCEAFSLPP